jgi:hypothetical protein
MLSTTVARRNESGPTRSVLSSGAFLMEFLDRSIVRERRMEALWKRASRGPFEEEFRETLLFESYEDREHARILRRHRATAARALGIERRSPGSRASKVGRTFSPAAALAEALCLKASSRAEYAGMVRFVEERFLRKFVEVLANSEDASLPHLLERAGAYGIRPKSPDPVRAAALRPMVSTMTAPALASTVA